MKIQAGGLWVDNQFLRSGEIEVLQVAGLVMLSVKESPSSKWSSTLEATVVLTEEQRKDLIRVLQEMVVVDRCFELGGYH